MNDYWTLDSVKRLRVFREALYKIELIEDTKQRQTLTKYRLSDHSLAFESSWLPREQCTCGHCMTGQIETCTLSFIVKIKKNIYIYSILYIFNIITHFHSLNTMDSASGCPV